MTPKTVRELRLAYDGIIRVEGIPSEPTRKALADHYRVSDSTIYTICTGKTWRNVSPPKCYRTDPKRGPKPLTSGMKIPIDERRVIRERFSNEKDLTKMSLTREYGVSRQTIYTILHEEDGEAA